MALGGGSGFLKQATMLEQLLEEINFQRTKEMRQLLKDDSGFVVLQGTTYWTDLFVRHFLFQEDKSIDCDDLLFFVRKRHVKGSSRHLPKYETEVEVFRKDSKKLPIGDPEIDWEETVYLNLVVHQFEYTLTLAVCTRTSPKQLQVLRRASHAVYASPSRRKMDSKGEGEEMTYPHICFMVDNFDEVFSDMVVRDGEMVCVELAARGRGSSAVAVIFLGSIRYDALVSVYESRQTSLSTKVAQRMSFGLLGGRGAARCEFVRMKGPGGKGHAEMAVSKPRGSGLDTPSSEPGCDDAWDSDWEDEPEDVFVYKQQQRRLSDPSANIAHFVRGVRRERGDKGDKGERGDRGDMSRSTEGLESLVPGITEVDAGDVRDDPPASSAALRPTNDNKQCEVAEDAVSLDHTHLLCDKQRRTIVTCNESVTVRGKEELPIYRDVNLSEEDNGNEGDDECERDGDNARRRPPTRTTPDGTVIYYWCDLPKRKSELDDGAYNPLYSRARGAAQSYALWKEGRRRNSAPLAACLTYVTLPCWSIASDILEHREQPILTF